MVKVSVAILAALLVLAGPAAAQDPPNDAEGSETPEEPAPQEGSDPSGGDTSSAQSQSTSAACRVAKSYVLDPDVPINGWIVLDPDHCVQRTVYRMLSRPVSEACRLTPW